MPDVIGQYIDQVLSHAALAVGDRQRVRAELQDHLQELIAHNGRDASTPEETLTMLHREFGHPQDIGKAIAAAKGRFRTYLKKQKRRLPIALAVTLVLALSVKWAVAAEFYAATDAAAPSIPKGSRMLVYKLTSSFRPGDVVVYRHPKGWAGFGVVRSVAPDALVVARNGQPDETVPRSTVIGRVVLNTR